MRYLIVEDDPNLRLLWNTVLSDLGHVVIEADTLDGARAALHSTPFDAMVLDLYLGRDNALSLAVLAGDLRPDCKVIIVTGAAELSDDEIRSIASSVVSVQRKPVDIEDLVDVCARIGVTAPHRAII